MIDYQHKNNLIFYIINALFCFTYCVDPNNYYLLINRGNLDIMLITILDYSCSLLTPKYYNDNNFVRNYSK